jgi:1-aminocyclopropane-1-carboxylate deaminase/D-cysteine desulfhydrase-like pyridoxal-dependent ACC family enzyme
MSRPHLTTAQLRCAAERLPRVSLAHLPTPLDDTPRFSAELGVRVLIKRDDCTGLYLGGNKARHNEFVLADALALACDVVVWGAEFQSNNCRQTAAACAKLGLDCRLYLSPGKHRRHVQGNMLLDYLVGARVELVTAAIGPELDALLKAKAEEARAEGRRPYVWDRRRVLPRAAVSYALCIAEIADQCATFGITPAAVYVSTAGATGAGVALGKALLGVNWAVRSVYPMAWPWDVPTDLASTASAAAELLGLPHRVRPDEIEFDDRFIGEYGRPSAEGQAALVLLARTEGILLDPVYSAKAMAALIADVRSGVIPQGSEVVFIHTGGTPVVFSMAEEMLQSVGAAGAL